LKPGIKDQYFCRPSLYSTTGNLVESLSRSRLMVFCETPYSSASSSIVVLRRWHSELMIPHCRSIWSTDTDPSSNGNSIFDPLLAQKNRLRSYGLANKISEDFHHRITADPSSKEYCYATFSPVLITSAATGLSPVNSSARNGCGSIAKNRGTYQFRRPGIQRRRTPISTPIPTRFHFTARSI